MQIPQTLMNRCPWYSSAVALPDGRVLGISVNNEVRLLASSVDRQGTSSNLQGGIRFRSGKCPATMKNTVTIRDGAKLYLDT